MSYVYKNKTTLFIDSLIWIRSLPDEQMGPSERMLEDVETYCHTNKIGLITYEIHCKNGFKSAFKNIKEFITQHNITPIIHFDIHGNKDEGLLIYPSGEYLNYEDLNRYLREINQIIDNQLVCIFATCESFQYLLKSSPTKLTPTFITYAPSKKIETGTLEKIIAPFYKELFETKNIAKSYENHLKKDMDEYHCVKMFILFIHKYYKEYNSSRKILKHSERLITKAVQKLNAVGKKPNLKLLRSIAKSHLEFNQKKIDSYANVYLGSKAPHITVDNIKNS
jgi:hypothetical protein